MRELEWEADEAAMIIPEYNPPARKNLQHLSAFFANRLTLDDEDVNGDHMEIE